ncbi:MAG: DUF4139 domain-containing protein [Campylobacterales bacterium]|nr:DUF4139 domain-containing protein [Campylobacterales bacterium]
MRFLAPLLLSSLSLMANTALLEIYTNKAFLTQRFDVGSGVFETTLPEFVHNDTLFIRTPCATKEITIGTPTKANTPLQAQIETATQTLQTARQQLLALEAKERLLERVAFTNSSFGDLQKNAEGFTTLALETLAAKNDQEEVVNRAQEALDLLTAKHTTSNVKPLSLSLTCNAPSMLEIRFEIPNLQANRVNTFTGESVEGRLAVTQSLFVSHTLGEDLNNIALRLYSFGYNHSLTPVPFYPQYVGLPETLPMMRTMALKSTAESTQDVAGTPVELESKEAWEASGVTLPSGERTQVVFHQQRVFAQYGVEVDGYGTAMAYMRASFTPETTIEPAMANFVLDGMLLGERSNVQFLAAEEAHIYFGKHDLIDVEKKLVRNFTTESGFGSTKTTERMWRYTVTNRSSKSQKIDFLERLPLSSHEKVVIKRLGDAPDTLDAEGKARWNFTLGAGEKRTLEFGYTQSEPIAK